MTASQEYRCTPVSDLALIEPLKGVTRHSASADARNVTLVQSNGTEFVVADLHFMRAEERGQFQTVAQTVAYYPSGTLRLPQFSIQPADPMTSAIWKAVGIEDVDFSSHPHFSSAYHLFAANTGRIRSLFDDHVLDALGRQPGFWIESNSDGLFLYRENQLCDAEALKGFAGLAAQIFRLFDHAARQAGMTKYALRPPKQDARALIEKMPGLMGHTMRKELVSHEDVEAFVRQMPPRKISSGLRAYLERQASQVVMGVGVMFAAGGTAFIYRFGSQALNASHGSLGENIGGMLLGLLFAAIGSPMAYFSIRARRRIKRLLRHGRTAEGRIETVAPTGASVNGVEQFLITVRYSSGGRDIRASCKDIGFGAERARRHIAEGTPVTILVDPADPQRVLLADALISFSPAFEE